MKVMTFNIRGSFHEDGANAWGQRRDLNIATILNHDPDIIGFQEAQQGNLEDYARTLTAYDVELGFISVRQAENYHRVPIYWKKDRYHKQASGGFYLSDTPDEWSIGWQATFARAVTWVRLQALDTDATFVVLNTHYPHMPGIDDTRTNCSRLILERLQTIAPDSPAIITGDFNALPADPAYTALLEGGFVDTYTAAGQPDGVATFHDFKGDAFEYPGLRLDWILVRGFSAESCKVITDAAPPIYTSDHYPVMAEVTMQKQTPLQ